MGFGCSDTRTSPRHSFSLPQLQYTKEVPSPTKPIKVSFLLTNDLHGHVENGLTYLGSIADQIRSSPEYKKNEAALIVLDSGDQFQGTLMSNFDEGETMFKTLNQIGYDAVIPGNHDYDFGPLGWLYDKPRADHSEDNPRGVIGKLANMANFPLISANTYLKSSIKQKLTGNKIIINDSCAPVDKAIPSSELDFASASGPEFLKPYVIVEKAGLKIALIGIDNHSTSTTTTYDSVADLCFRDEVDTYVEVRKQLEGKADVFVLVMHNGNASNSFDGSEIAEKINKAIPNGVHLVAAGHTHNTHDVVAGGVHVIQDGANGRAFGRVDLFVDPSTRQVLPAQTKSKAGIAIDANKCDKTKLPFVCDHLSLPIPSHPVIDTIITDALSKVAPLAKRKVAVASEKVEINRVNESALGDILADALRKATGTQVSFMNTGGIRTDLAKGDILYEDLFEVSPFQNQAVIIRGMKWSMLRATLDVAAKTCGAYGTLVVSGIKMKFERYCAPNTSVDPRRDLSLLHVELNDGTVLYDKDTGVNVSDDYPIDVTTLDFLALGGSGYATLKGSAISETPGIARELIVEALAKEQPTLNNKTDHRFYYVVPVQPKNEKKAQ